MKEKNYLTTVFTAVFCFILWELLAASVAPRDIVLGIIVSIIVALFSTRFFVHNEGGKMWNPVRLLLMGGYAFGKMAVEIVKANVDEMAAYMDRYFEYHRIKYKHQQSSLTVRGKNGGLQHKWIFSDSADHFKDGDTRSLRMICGDTRNALAYLKSSSVHLMVTDLPYGVQTGTAGKEDGLLGTVSMALPGWFDTLKPGGVLCMSFNTHTIRRDALIEAIQETGFAVVDTGNLEHWVEQAIERDVVIAKKERVQE